MNSSDEKRGFEVPVECSGALKERPTASSDDVEMPTVISNRSFMSILSLFFARVDIM